MKRINFSKVIAGTMSWGTWGKNFSSEQMTGKIHQYCDLGVTTFDHADIYGDSTTEATFGKAFNNSGIQRDAIQLISKCGIKLPYTNNSFITKH